MSRWILSLAACVSLMVSCSPRAADMASANTLAGGDLEEMRTLLSGIERGATGAEVADLLGSPDEVRRGRYNVWYPVRRDDRLVHVREDYAWAYGAASEGEFVRVGLVIFDDDGRVLSVACPVRVNVWATIVEAGADKQAAAATGFGLSCRLSNAAIVTRGHTEHGPRIISEVTLLNEGDAEYIFKADTVSILANLVVEVFDAEMTLICRRFRIQSHSPISPDEDDWPTLAIPAGGAKSARGYITSGPVGYGELPVGRYYVRVGFPFERDRYFMSNVCACDAGDGRRDGR